MSHDVAHWGAPRRVRAGGGVTMTATYCDMMATADMSIGALIKNLPEIV